MKGETSAQFEFKDGGLEECGLTVRATHEPGEPAQTYSMVASNPAAAGANAEKSEMRVFVELTSQQLDGIVRTVSGGGENIQGIYPLSSLQEGMLFHNLMNHSSDTYLFSTLFEVPSAVLVSAFIDAVQKVIDRHESLRTAILWEELPHAVQVICRSASVRVEQLVLPHDCDPLEQIKELMKPQHQKLDLTLAPAMRLLVAKGAEDDKHHVLLQAHHIVFDYQARQNLITEIMAYLDGRERELPMPTSYENYLAQMLAQSKKRDPEGFFRCKLGDVNEPTAPFGLLDVHGDGSQLAESSLELEPDLVQQIRALSWRAGGSAARLIHAAWALVVAHTSGKDDVVIGTVLSMRQRNVQSRDMLGMSVNTLPLRLQLSDKTVKELVEHTHQELGELLKYAADPLSLALRCSSVTGTTPLFTTLISYRRSASAVQEALPTAAGIRMVANHGTWTNYPVTIQVDDLGERIVLLAQADQRIDPQRMTAYLRAAMRSLVDALARAPQTLSLSLSILPASELHQIIVSFNATQSSYPKDKLVHQLFEEQAQRTPDAAAVICGTRMLTYAQLHDRSNRLANLLMARGVCPDTRVALYMERSVEMMVGLLAVLKAGGAYVPLDVSYPLERLQYMLRDSVPVILLTQARLRNILPMDEAQVIAVDASDDAADYEADEGPGAIQLGLQPQHLAYVIYTSGSTGAPKGVMVEHRNLLNLVHWHSSAFQLHEGSRCSSVAAIGFDAATWEIWPPLTIGATLVLAMGDVASDAEKLIAWWSNQSIDVGFLPTPLAEFAFSRNLVPAQLRTLLVGGDRLRYRPATGAFELINNYGPTETTVVATSGQIRGDDTSLHIGRPIANTQIYILDSRRQVVPVGITGEMYIGGAGVARGYLNRPDLTAERFVFDPFSSDPQARLYRTGDLARWRADGTIEYMGRNDHQVKIRGYRIELGEIEARLMAHSQVKDAVVIARQDVKDETQLVAYFTQRCEATCSVAELRAHMELTLPKYMIPAAFVMLENFPLTPHGKLDQRALPRPELTAYAGSHNDPPQGELENRLARIWQELLQVQQVGRQDSFFDLGGHSLLAVKSLFHINQAFDCSLQVADIYKSPSLRELAARIGGSTSQDELIDLSEESAWDDSIVAISGLTNRSARQILFTGATGFLGRFLLAQLLRDTDATLHCIVRGQSELHAFSRVRATLSKWNLWSPEFEQRIVAIPGDLGQPRLGIDEAIYRSLSWDIDCIYHCGTSMNHLESYRMAKPTNVGAARELIKFATSHKAKPINYISTLGVFGSVGAAAARSVDEFSSIDAEKHSNARGYVASKWVSEKLFMSANERGIPCNIFRVGLVWADSQQGRYDELQQGYRVFKSCLLSGLGIQNYRYPMVPTPVDYVAQAIAFLAARYPDGNGIFHISSSAQSVEGVFERCNEIAGTSLELLPHFDWICAMKGLHHAGRSLPAVPLIEYAFSMDEATFQELQRNGPTAGQQFDCTRTHRELESAGIVAPPFDDNLLKVYVESMLQRDPDVREFMEGSPS